MPKMEAAVVAVTGAIRHQIRLAGATSCFAHRVGILHHKALSFRVPVEPNLMADDNVCVGENAERHYEDGKCVESVEKH